MSTHGTPRIEASDAEWAALWSGDADDFELVDGATETSLEDLLAPSEEVQRVSRRIAGQYVEVVARFAASAFGRSDGGVSTEQVTAAVGALLRLAAAANDDEQRDLLEELLMLVVPATTGRRNARSRQTAIAALREWMPRFARTLEPEDSRRLVNLVQWDSDAAPLLDELAGIRGIGPVRLGRLYSAGLFTIDAVAGADPEDIVAVTGIPIALAHDVVKTTRVYAVEERERCLSGLVEQANRLRRVLKAMPTHEHQVTTAAREALAVVERTLIELKLNEEQA